MDAETFVLVLVSLVYLGFAIRHGMGISIEEARRFFRLLVIGAPVLLAASILIAVDSSRPFLPHFIALPVIILFCAPLMLAFYSLFLGGVLLFREPLRRLGVRMLCAAGLPLIPLLYGGRFL